MIELLMVAILATWRIAALLTCEDGPRNALRHWRQRLGVDMETDEGAPATWTAWLLGCFWCCSLVVALPVSLLLLIQEQQLRPVQLLYPFAISGGAIILNHLSRCYLQMMD